MPEAGEQTAGTVEVRHNAVPGRLRLGVPGLRRRPGLAGRLRGAAGIWRAEARLRTGSLVVSFDPALAWQDVLAEVERLLREPAPSTGDRPAPADGGGMAEDANKDTAPSWHAMAAEDVLARLGTDADTGLTGAEARDRLARLGANVLAREEPPSALALFAKQFESLPVLMLAGSAVVSVATGGRADAVATLAVVMVNAVVGYVTEGQAERVIHDLMDTTRQSARVWRDGAETEIPARDVVPGDVVVLSPGIRVTADARLTSDAGLMIDESMMTGESLPVAKSAGATLEPRTPLADRAGMVYAGTLVAEGRGRAVVVATGEGTEAARTQRLATAAIRPRSPVEAELEDLGRWLGLGSLAACGLFFAIGAARGIPLPVILRDALALAVAAVPEGLPMVATTTLSLGLRRMERRGILIRKMHIVESLGAVQTICLDKTGTLTENRMTVAAAVAGTEMAGPSDSDALAPLAEVAALNSDARLEEGRAAGSSATETALLDFAVSLGIGVEALRAARPRLEAIERTPAHPWMATRHGGDGAQWLVKGAPETLLAASTHVLDAGAERPLTADDARRIEALNERLATRPARVLAFARCDGPLECGAPSGLTFLGLVGLVDPVRQGAPEFIRRLHAAGIATVLITGDQAGTAAATARELGLAPEGRLRVVDSLEVGALDPEVLAGIAQQTHVFARVASHEKLLIVKALQSAGRVVAMTGDGVNDGPALNAADVGIAMGGAGAGLAREVANVVIRDDELTTLLEAIGQGRAIHRNIRRSLEFLVTTNLSEILVSLVEAAHGPGELETPMELLWINLITDVLPGLGLALADPDPDLMTRPPRAADETIIPRRDAARMAQDSAMIGASALGAHFIGLARHGPGPQTRAMTFLALSQGQLLYTLACQRSDRRRLDPRRILENRTLDLALLASSGLGLLPFLSPALGRLLGIARLGPADTAVALAAAAMPLTGVLLRRGFQIGLEDLEGNPCARRC